MLLYWILLPIVWVLAHIVFRIQVIGRENLKAVRDGRAYVIAPNHIANLDPVLIAITIFDWKRLRILAKEELFKNPNHRRQRLLGRKLPGPGRFYPRRQRSSRKAVSETDGLSGRPGGPPL